MKKIITKKVEQKKEVYICDICHKEISDTNKKWHLTIEKEWLNIMRCAYHTSDSLHKFHMHRQCLIKTLTEKIEKENKIKISKNTKSKIINI